MIVSDFKVWSGSKFGDSRMVRVDFGVRVKRYGVRVDGGDWRRDGDM